MVIVYSIDVDVLSDQWSANYCHLRILFLFAVVQSVYSISDCVIIN
jgi:hypothetical protein